jgi:hypothetical protein
MKVQIDGVFYAVTEEYCAGVRSLQVRDAGDFEAFVCIDKNTESAHANVDGVGSDLNFFEVEKMTAEDIARLVASF